MLRWSTWPPAWVATPLSRRTGSDVERGEEDGEGGIEDDHDKDRMNDRARGVAAKALGGARDREPFVAADERDGGGEERRLDDAEPKAPHRERLVKLLHEHGERHPQH